MQEQNFQAAVVWGVMYTVSVTLIGLGLGHHTTWQFGVLTMALAFFTHAAQAMSPQVPSRASLIFALASWLSGAIAGISLFF